jgi:hypothetical protein
VANVCITRYQDLSNVMAERTKAHQLTAHVMAHAAKEKILAIDLVSWSS